MSKRKGLSPSLRWSVFSRDGFTCRYCGAQAGQEGVELAVDHVVSVAEGGDDRIDNLATACRKCNGGKGAKSLKAAPTNKEVVARIEKTTATLQEQAAAMSASIKAQHDLERLAVSIKCQAYGRDPIHFERGEAAHITRLCQAHGADQVLEWYRTAAENGVRPRSAIKYVYGIIRNLRTRQEAAGAQ